MLLFLRMQTSKVLFRQSKQYKNTYLLYIYIFNLHIVVLYYYLIYLCRIICIKQYNLSNY